MTPAQLQERVLQEIGVLATGESPIAADALIVSQKYAALYEMLVTKNLVTWSADEDIPQFTEGPIVSMVSYLCARPFGVPPSKLRELELAGALDLSPGKGGPSDAEAQLRKQVSRGFVYSPAETEYF